MIGRISKWPHGAMTRSTGLKRVCWWSAGAVVKCPLLCHLTTLCRTTCVKLTQTFQKWVLPGWLTLKWPRFNMSSSLADLICWEDVPDAHLHKLPRCASVAVQNSRSARPKSSKWHVDYIIRVACKFRARVFLLLCMGSEDPYKSWDHETSWKATSWTSLGQLVGAWSVRCCWQKD